MNQSTVKTVILSKKFIILLSVSSCLIISVLGNIISGLDANILLNYKRLTPIVRDGGITK